MGRLGKYFTLCLVVIFAVSILLMVIPVKAETIPKPSVPEFAVRIVSNPYLVPQEDLTDPYTGHVTIYPSHISENKSIVVTVKNQQFVSTQLSDGNWTRLYYNLRFEGHFTQNDWSYYPVIPVDGPGSAYIDASQSEFTTIPIPKYMLPATYPNGTQIDFQVQALIGYDKSTYAPSMTPGQQVYTGSIFTGESSDWSPSETLIFGDPLNASPIPSPTVPEFPITLSLVAVLFAVSLLLIISKKSNL
jgi:hypothetical protein